MKELKQANIGVHFGILGKATAIAALCLFAFTAPAQTGRVLHVAPGQGVFTYGRDTVDTNALPAFFRTFGADSTAALYRTAVCLVYLEKGVDRLDTHIRAELGGIGLREYVWFRGWLIMCDDVREDYNSNRNRK